MHILCKIKLIHIKRKYMTFVQPWKDMTLPKHMHENNLICVVEPGFNHGSLAFKYPCVPDLATRRLANTPMLHLWLYSMQNAETLTTHTHSIMLKKKLEHGTPTVALTQSFSSEALQALLLEKCFTNCFAVGLLDLDRKGRVYKWISGYDLLHIIQV